MSFVTYLRISQTYTKRFLLRSIIGIDDIKHKKKQNNKQLNFPLGLASKLNF